MNNIDKEIMKNEISGEDSFRRHHLGKMQKVIVKLVMDHGPITTRELANIFSLKITNASTKLNTLWKKEYFIRSIITDRESSGLEYKYSFNTGIYKLNDDAVTQQYYDLIMAVENKNPDENRHETALRLIKDGQMSSGAASNRH